MPLARILAPYDVRLGGPGSITAGELREQARRLGFARADATVLAGRSYVQACRAVWPLADAPPLGLGIGYQRQFLAVIRDGRA
ncbi:hypothetical protein [Streptomyces sp. HPF1205]|uniref:hypothetical protein n=1 Tax=Streptomyces sp. HPF1205 TaxID=2873262 RepID=UPI001CED0FE7|nr:hypothetical protein [Streptomyces sp. HPF1205]